MRGASGRTCSTTKPRTLRQLGEAGSNIISGISLSVSGVADMFEYGIMDNMARGAACRQHRCITNWHMFLASRIKRAAYRQHGISVWCCFLRHIRRAHIALTASRRRSLPRASSFIAVPLSALCCYRRIATWRLALAHRGMAIAQQPRRTPLCGGKAAASLWDATWRSRIGSLRGVASRVVYGERCARVLICFPLFILSCISAHHYLLARAIMRACARRAMPHLRIGAAGLHRARVCLRVFKRSSASRTRCRYRMLIKALSRRRMSAARPQRNRLIAGEHIINIVCAASRKSAALRIWRGRLVSVRRRCGQTWRLIV